MSTYTQTHTRTHARYVAAKIVTDLKRLQRLAGRGIPSDLDIENFRQEAELYLFYGYLDTVTYGFVKNNSWILPLRYKVTSSNGVSDEDPGGLDVNRDISGTSFGSFLVPSYKWFIQPEQEKEVFKKLLPFQRSSGSDHGGTWEATPDNSYQSGDIAVNRIRLVSP